MKGGAVMELMELARQAEPILREAGELVRSMVHPKVYTKEGHANFVTEADLASQKFLLEHLSPLGPGGRPPKAPVGRRSGSRGTGRYPPARG